MKIGYLMQAGVPDMRVAPLSGPAVHVQQVCAELRRLGHDVRLVARFDDGIWLSDDLQQYRPAPATWLDSGLPRLLERVIRRVQATLRLPYAALFDSLRFAAAARQALRGYDVLYERMGWMGYGGGLAARRMGVPHLFEVNGDHLSELETLGMAPRGAQRGLSIWLMQRAIARARHIVTAGEGWRARFLARWRVDPAHVTSIENGTQLVDLLAAADLRAFAAAPAAGPLTIAYEGALFGWHGVRVLLAAFAAAVRQGVDARLLLIGSGPEEAALTAQAAALGVSDCVTFTGHVGLAQLADYLAAADMGVSPYCGRAEFSGLKLLDYKAAGLAIIASGQDGQPAILEHGRTAWIVPPCDEAALSAAIVRLSQDAALRRALGQAARREAEARHSWRHTAEQISRLLARQ